MVEGSDRLASRGRPVGRGPRVNGVRPGPTLTAAQEAVAAAVAAVATETAVTGAAAE
jgi:hypothetical protein